VSASASQRILLIDDSVLVVEAITDALEGEVVVEGVTDVDAVDPSQPLDRFDLILIDVQMPSMFGDDVAMVMRHRRGETPIVLLSSLPEQDLAVRASEAGIDGYISKRRGVDNVIAEIRSWLAETQRRRKREA
jgi:two-component system response regulator FimZ (fimbrial Z protein)